MTLDRRRFSLALAAAALAPAAAAARPPITDMVGRTVDLRRPVERVVLLDARDILTMALLHPEPSRLVAGWAAPEMLDSDLVRGQYETRPDGPIPQVGGQVADTLSVERIISIGPDLVVATARHDPALGEGVLTRRLAAAGIPVVFSDAASNRTAGAAADSDPIRDLGRLMRMWGALLGRERRAESFVELVRERLGAVADRTRGMAPCKTYLELQSTYDDCCWSAGTRIWGDLLALAGGRNLSVVNAPWYAKVAIEQLVTEAPEVYIACGGAFAGGTRPAIGPGLDPERGRAGLRRLCARTGLATLPAVRHGRVHGIWTGLLTIRPLNVLFVEAAARWLHPDALAGLDPTGTLAELNRRFLAKPLPGPCWVSLGSAGATGPQ